MSSPTKLRPVLVALVLCGSLPRAGYAQARVVTTSELPNRCPTTSVTPAIVTPQARRDAQQLAGKAQAASIQGDNVAATDLYSRAALLDPTDAGIAYSLGREYEATRDSRALSEYCRFLALAPASPEATNVRQRIAELALALPRDTSIVAVPVAQGDVMPSAGAALVYGLLVPGMGQFATHAPVAGVLVLAASAGAAYWGLQSQTITTQVTRTAIDPLGHPYQYQTTGTVSSRPNLAAGLGGAAALSVIAAFQAYSRARSAREPAAGTQSAGGDSPPPALSAVSSPTLVLRPGSASLALSFR